MSTVDVSAAVIDAARALATPVRLAAEAIERERRLPASLVEAMAAAGRAMTLEQAIDEAARHPGPS